MKVEGLESTLEILQKSENELKQENATLSSENAKKKKDADQTRQMREERDRLKEQVMDLQRDNSAQQAKILLGALGSSSGSSSLAGVGSLLGNSVGLMASSEADSADGS